MSDLSELRDHARDEAERTVDRRDSTAARYSSRCYPDNRPTLADHALCGSRVCRCDCHPRHVPTERERRLWVQIADEIDAYLAPEDEGEGLF